MFANVGGRGLFQKGKAGCNRREQILNRNYMPKHRPADLFSILMLLTAYGMGLADIRTERQHMINETLSPSTIASAETRVAKLIASNLDNLTEQGIAGYEIRHEVSALCRYKSTDTTLGIALSDADTMLEYLAPHAGKPQDISVLTRPGCPYCAKAKGMLRDAGLEFEELVLNRDYTDRTLRAIAAADTVPQVFVNGEHIGGSEALEDWLGSSHSQAA